MNKIALTITFITDRNKLAIISKYKIDIRKSIYTKLIDNQDLRLIKMPQDYAFVLPGIQIQ